MLLFIDESGDPGMKEKPGSSEYFVMTAVLFEDHDEALACDNTVEALRPICFHGRHQEFHFSKCSDDIRRKFFQAVAGYEFMYAVFVLNKKNLWGQGFRFKESFYKYAANLLFQNIKPYLQDAIVVLDSCGNREFQKQLERYLKKRVNTGELRGIRKIKMNRSDSNNLLQLADMVCGAVARALRREKRQAGEFRRMIAHRELITQIWPKN